jgi:GrpB-like predicted nucleotidyltransferase (UPF0157 family)
MTAREGPEQRSGDGGRDWVDEVVRIAPYDPASPQRFEEEKALLEKVIGDWATGGIHHVGSTAVPGLDAKPVIDILVGVEGLGPARAAFEPLQGVGYLYAPYRAHEMHWFCKPDPSHRTHHVHLVPTGSKRFKDELTFRDYLRGNSAAAADYATLKRELATKFEDDREAYTRGKAEFIAAALAR